MPDRFAHFLFSVCRLASTDVGGFDPNKCKDQLRVAFQASQVARKKRRHHELGGKREPKPKKRKKDFDSTTSEEDEGLREDIGDRAFHDTLVDFDEFME